MNKERASLWTKALRSDRFPQGGAELRNRGGYSALGVACEVYLECNPSLRPFFRFDTPTRTWYGYEHITLPYGVAKWYGLKTVSGKYDPMHGEQNSVAWDGYAEIPFHTTADNIDKHYSTM